MPQGGRAVHIDQCPNDWCLGPLMAMQWTDGFGLDPEVFEHHCSWCGYTADPEGNVIRQSHRHEKQQQGKEQEC
ncbi:hypothetical protein HY949_01910 [Candidatus Gottesmanbacteria bacterium]|nr:hypothetical protein [Candidatus Gottesmanbacteria bacterium]